MFFNYLAHSNFSEIDLLISMSILGKPPTSLVHFTTEPAHQLGDREYEGSESDQRPEEIYLSVVFFLLGAGPLTLEEVSPQPSPKSSSHAEQDNKWEYGAFLPVESVCYLALAQELWEASP